MYTRFLGFKENPFKLTPDPDSPFPSRCHEDAPAHLRYGIAERKAHLRQGDQELEVLRVQRILHAMGYLVEPNGRYDAADGIVGPRTRALL